MTSLNGEIMNLLGRFDRTTRARRRLARGVTLVEVLIVVAIMAVISGGVTLVAFPLFKESRIKIAIQGAGAVKQAAELEKNLDGTSDCPQITDLVASKKLDAKKTEDPWGTTFKVDCSDGDIHVISAGNDKKFGTPDDVRDDFKPTDIDRVKKL
jgi:general secretion pathway protein G